MGRKLEKLQNWFTKTKVGIQRCGVGGAVFLGEVSAFTGSLVGVVFAVPVSMATGCEKSPKRVIQDFAFHAATAGARVGWWAGNMVGSLTVGTLGMAVTPVAVCFTTGQELDRTRGDTGAVYQWTHGAYSPLPTHHEMLVSSDLIVGETPKEDEDSKLELTPLFKFFAKRSGRLDEWLRDKVPGPDVSSAALDDDLISETDDSPHTNQRELAPGEIEKLRNIIADFDQGKTSFKPIHEEEEVVCYSPTSNYGGDIE